MADGPRRFATTRWSVVIAAGQPGAPDAAAALASLCEAYWVPVYAYVRGSGKSNDDARDLTQAFFAHLIEKNAVRLADPERGRFRSFLLASVRHFVANEYHAATAQKRGGGARHIPIAIDPTEEGFPYEPADPETPELAFERRWALAVLAEALTRLSKRYADADRRRLFDGLRPYLTGDESASYAQLAVQLDKTEDAVKVAVHRLRRAYRESLREVIEETVERPADVDDELRYLLSVLSRARR